MKRFLFFIGIILILFLIPVSSWAQPKVKADAAILIDGYTGEILWKKNAHKFRPGASTIKMLTTLISLEQSKRSDKVIVGKKAHQTHVGQTIGLVQGDQLSVEDLVKASLLWSANDAAVALAEHVGGSVPLFTLMMKKKAMALGAYNSNFKNPNGYFKPGQYSTAYDLALIARAAMHNPFFATTVRKNNGEIKWLNKEKNLTLSNTNRLLGYYEGCNGIKTGTTSAAGGCLASSAVRGNAWLISVVLASSKRYADSSELLNYGFENFVYVHFKKGQVFEEIKVRGGGSHILRVVPDADVHMIVPRSEALNLETKIELKRDLRAPVRKGQVLGSISVYYNKELVTGANLVAGENIKKIKR